MNIQEIKKDFAIFDTHPDLIYLDSAATSLTPRTVVDKITQYYNAYNANIARGTYKLSETATENFELSRKTVADFITATEDEIVFTSGTTMSLNMIARGLSHLITKNDAIITTKAEHHANFIPWQQTCKEKNATFVTIDITADGEIDIDALLNAIDENTKIIALAHVSNVLGTINPIAELITQIRAKKEDVIVVIDAAQSVAHIPVNVRELDCDFLTFSGHKIFGPTGVGVLYGKKHQLKKLTPLLTGGEMISEVTSQCTTFRDVPHRLETGTPDIASVIALHDAILYVQNIGFDTIQKHEKELTEYCTEQLQKNFGDDITIYGPKDNGKRSGIISFAFKNHHPHDIASILDNEKSVAIRAGQHCTMPLHLESLEVGATARASFSIYNSTQDIGTLIDGLKIVDEKLS